MSSGDSMIRALAIRDWLTNWLRPSLRLKADKAKTETETEADTWEAVALSTRRLFWKQKTNYEHMLHTITNFEFQRAKQQQNNNK